MAAISHKQKIGSVAGNSAASIQVTGTTVAGNDIIVGVVWYTASGSYPTCTVTDAAGNSYTTIASFTGSAATGPSYLVVQAHNTTALSAGAITATFTGTAPFSTMIADEWVGLTATLDGSNATNNGSGTAVGLAAKTTTNANDLILGLTACFGNLAAPTWPASWVGNEWQSAAPSIGFNWQLASGGISSKAATITISTTEIWQTAVIAIKGVDTAPTLYRLGAQDNLGSSATASVSVTYPGATTSGNLLIATAYSNNANPPAISGWTAFTAGINANTAMMGVFYKIATGSETTITATATSATVMELHIYEYTGNANPASLDVAFSSSATTTGMTSWPTPSITTTNAVDLLFGLVALNGNSTVQSFSGLNIRQVDPRLIDGDLVTSATQTGFTGTAAWSGVLKPTSIIGAFKAASTGTITAAPIHMMMGMGS